MKTSQIVKVAVLPDSRLAIFPDVVEADYQYIYCEAAGVSWDQNLGCFKSTPPHDWGYAQWYQNIVSLVRSAVGLDMRLSSSTVYDAEIDGFTSLIQAAEKDLERWYSQHDETKK